ncbi:MAG: NTP transferase domain-containing protein [Caldisericaceae bacterium]|nr:NTP transferase domain-containing protein [Caldisericaceae bacterium]
MNEKLLLMNGAEIKFTSIGITYSDNGKLILIKFKDPGAEMFVSLVLLAANEERLSRALKLYRKFKSVSEIKETIIVGNRLSDKNILRAYNDIKFVINPKPESPIITSLKYAISSVSNFSKYIIVCPVSKRTLESEGLSKFIEKTINKNLKFSVPLINKKRLHPIMIRRSEFEKIRRNRKEQGLKYLSKKLFTEVEIG